MTSTPRSPSPRAQLALLSVLVVLPALLFSVGVVGALTGADPTTSSRAAADAPCPPAPPFAPVLGESLHATLITTANEPTWVANHPTRPGAGVLTERPGHVRAIRGGQVDAAVLIDLTPDTATQGDGGLLAAAYDPTGTWLYLARTTRDGDDVVTAHRLGSDGEPDSSAPREILRIVHGPSLQHHGGSLASTPNGNLLIGVGDGGGLGDPRDNAQDPTTLLGKVLRIQPTPSAERPYAIPADNPFVDRYRWRPEIWALGVRNPYRTSIDPQRGDVWVGDVGQSCWEEIDQLDLDGGANLEWDRREGTGEFEGGEVVGRPTAPTFAVPHAARWCAIVAGYVPHDEDAGPLDGRMLASDYCSGRLISMSPDDPSGTLLEHPVDELFQAITAVVPGPDGHPWALSLDGPIWQLSPQGA